MYSVAAKQPKHFSDVISKPNHAHLALAAMHEAIHAARR